MIGIFDSGVGGFNALCEVRASAPLADIVYLADAKNAPYGTKNEDEILTLVKRDIKILRNRGASLLLIACCTASTVYGRLSSEEQRICLPIISPAARVAAKHRSVAVIATDATVRSRAFSRAIRAENPECRVTEIAAQPLVSFVEEGARDGRLSVECESFLCGLAQRIALSECEALVLGCTHFSHLEGELSSRLAGTRIISPAREGARALLRSKNGRKYARGSGKTIYMTG